MKQRKMQLYAVSVVLIAMMLMSQSGIINAMPQAPKSILADTLVGSDPFIEGLELIGAEDDSLIAQYYQWGGQKTFPLDPSNSEFDNLDLLYIISSNQENWNDYWPRSIWEFRDGATVVFQFSQGLTDSLDDAAAIIPALNTWMGTTLDVLFGVYDEISTKTTVFYWGYMSAENHSDFIVNEFYDVLNTGGYTNFITNEVISSAPVSVVATGIVKSTSTWVPLAVAGFILDNAIFKDGDLYNMSINDAFDYSGTIQPAPSSSISTIKFLLPYVATVYDSYPKTDNLYPELTGSFNWTLKVVGYIDNSYNDIYVTYSMASEEISTFPQITAEVDVNITSLHSPFDPKLNYTIEMTNTGNEVAKNVVFAWNLGERPKPTYISVFDNDTYMFNESVEMWWNFTDGTLVPEKPVFFARHVCIKGWFTYKNGVVVQPASDFNATENMYHMNLTNSLDIVYNNKSFFTFNYSSNLYETTLDNGNFALAGLMTQLNPMERETFWWSVSDLPAKDDSYLALNPPKFNNSGPDYNMTLTENSTFYSIYGNNLQDYLVKNQTASGIDLRFPSLNMNFIPGVMFRYEDNASREYFGWSNGLVIQLYDDEAILKTTVAVNATIYEMYEQAQINVTIENIGDAPATNVQVQGFHAQLGPNWELQHIKSFSGEESIGTINPGESKTHIFIREVKTFIGIHPVGVVVDYSTEETEGYDGVFNRTDIYNLSSNVIVSLVMPKNETGGAEQEYPTPVVNVSVNWIDENGGTIANGDIIEIKTKITNLGTEATTIKAISYFPTRMASIVMGTPYGDGNFKVTDISGNKITDYTMALSGAANHQEWPISFAVVAGIHLAPGATIFFHYKLNVTDADSLILPPVAVEYDSRYPMAGTSGVEGNTQGGGSSPLSAKLDLGIEISAEQPSLRLKIQASYSASAWTSYSSPLDVASSTSRTSGVPGFTPLTSFIRENMELMIVVLAIPVVALVVKERRRRN